MRHHGISGPRAFLPRPELSSLEDVFGEVLAQKEKKLKKERKVRLDKSSARSSGVFLFSLQGMAGPAAVREVRTASRHAKTAR